MIFLIPFRNPYDHAFSLLNQHKKMKEKQSKDKFILKYMDSLGHNEFGLNYKSWNLAKNFSDSSSINHWLEQWCLFYEFIKRKYNDSKNIYLVNYELICKDKIYLNKICEILDVENFYLNNFFKLKNEKNIINADTNILNKTNELYNELTQLSFNQINR